MPHHTGESTTAITTTQGVLVVTMQPDTSSGQFESMRQTVLDRITRNKLKALVLDFSAIDVMNLIEFNRIRKFLASVRLLGTETAIVSLSVGVVLYLADIGADTDGIEYYFGLDEALRKHGTGT
jgi:anti-anti-sigma regulatory factor